jgi:hypothetical protein
MSKFNQVLLLARLIAEMEQPKTRTSKLFIKATIAVSAPLSITLRAGEYKEGKMGV